MMINNMLEELEERYIAKTIGIFHDETRMRYPLAANTVRDFDEFSRTIGHYFNYHYTTCITHGGGLTMAEATGRAKKTVEREYKRKGGDRVSAYNDAHDGTNGGMRIILDIIAEGLKSESVELHLLDVFDRYVTPNSWSQKVEIIRQFFSICGNFLAGSVRTDQPERYAGNYHELIQAYITGLQKTSSIFRRL